MGIRSICSIAFAALLAGCAPDNAASSDADPTARPTDAASAGTAASHGTAASAAEEAAVTRTLQTVFDALADGDAALLRSVMAPDVMMHFTETTADGATTTGGSTLDGLATRIESSDARLVERIWDPIVNVDGPIATIWAPYDFYVGSDFSHCGVDVATMIARDGGWTIVALDWSRRQPPDCALHPDGPPAG